MKVFLLSNRGMRSSSGTGLNKTKKTRLKNKARIVSEKQTLKKSTIISLKIWKLLHWKCLGGIDQIFDFKTLEIISLKIFLSNVIKSPFFNM